MFRTYIPPADFNVEAAQFRPNPRRGAPEPPPPQIGFRVLQKRPLEGDAPARVAVTVEMPAPKVRKTNNWERAEFFRGAHSSGKKFNAQINNLTIYQRQYMDNKNIDKWSIKILDAAIKYAKNADRPVDASTNRLFRNRALETNFSFDYVNTTRLEKFAKSAKGVTVLASDSARLPNATLGQMLEFSERESASLNLFVLIATMQKLENAKTVLAQGSSDKGSTIQALGTAAATLGTPLPPTSEQTANLNPNNPDATTIDGEVADSPGDGSVGNVEDDVKVVEYDADPSLHPDRSQDAEDNYLRLQDVKANVESLRRLREGALEEVGKIGETLKKFDYGSPEERKMDEYSFRLAHARFISYNSQLQSEKEALDEVTREQMALDGVKVPPRDPPRRKKIIYEDDGEKPLKNPREEGLRQFFNKFAPFAALKDLASLKIKQFKDAQRALAEAEAEERRLEALAERKRLDATRIQTALRGLLARRGVGAKLDSARRKELQKEADESTELTAAAEEEVDVARQAVADAAQEVENAREELVAVDPGANPDTDTAANDVGPPSLKPPSQVLQGLPTEVVQEAGDETDADPAETPYYDPEDSIPTPLVTDRQTARTASMEKRRLLDELQGKVAPIPMASFTEDDQPLPSARSNVSEKSPGRRAVTRGSTDPREALENLQNSVKQQLGLTMPAFNDKDLLDAFVIDLVDKASLVTGNKVKSKRNLAKATLRAMVSAGLITEILADGTKSTSSYLNELKDDGVDPQKMEALKGVLLRRLTPEPAGRGFAENMDSIVSASLIAEDVPNQQYLYVVHVR